MVPPVINHRPTHGHRPDARRSPARLLHFFRGRHLYQIAKAYDGESGYLGLRDGQIIARGHDRVEVARVLISSGDPPERP
jgi:hypothetical protein